jgi:hypothetical protein
MDTTLILWIWPAFVLGSVALFGLYVIRKDDVSRDEHHRTPAE